jgi:hypothetical protein
MHRPPTQVSPAWQSMLLQQGLSAEPSSQREEMHWNPGSQSRFELQLLPSFPDTQVPTLPETEQTSPYPHSQSSRQPVCVGIPCGSQPPEVVQT